jgi:hypothetical protein
LDLALITEVFLNLVPALMILFWHLTSAPVWQIVPNSSIGADLKARTIDVFLAIGNVMANKIAKMVMTNPHLVRNAFVRKVNSNARTKTAL